MLEGVYVCNFLTVPCKVRKFGTQIRDSVLIFVTKFHVTTSNTLAPPTGQSYESMKKLKKFHRPQMFTNLNQNWHK